LIARIGYFADFDMTDREYVLEAIREKPGFQGVYHLVHRESGRALSISFFETDEDAQVAQQAVGAAREKWRARWSQPGPRREMGGCSLSEVTAPLLFLAEAVA
jgi:hypothetical protein